MELERQNTSGLEFDTFLQEKLRNDGQNMLCIKIAMKCSAGT